MSQTLLLGHTCAENAYVIEDYPYGSLRCKRKVWIETRPGHGQRFVAMTNNPKKPGLVWNKPHPSTYSTICVMYLNSADGHVQIAWLGMYTYRDTLEAFVERFGEAQLCADPWIAKVLPIMRKVASDRKAVNG